MGPKSVQKSRPNTGLEIIGNVHLGSPAMRPDTYNVPPRLSQEMVSPAAQLMQRVKD